VHPDGWPTGGASPSRPVKQFHINSNILISSSRGFINSPYRWHRKSTFSGVKTWKANSGWLKNESTELYLSAAMSKPACVLWLGVLFKLMPRHCQNPRHCDWLGVHFSADRFIPGMCLVPGFTQLSKPSLVEFRCRLGWYVVAGP